WDSETGCPFGDKYKHALSDYATRKEIAALIAALKNLYRDKGREMRAAKLRAAERGLLEREWWRMPEGEEREIATRPGELKIERASINQMLASIRDDAFSWRYCACAEATQLVQPIRDRYDAAFEAARAEWERECEKIPIDDAAWEKELRRREALDARFGRSSIGT